MSDPEPKRKFASTQWSAGGDQEHSLEIVGFEAVASRKTKLTEHDIKEITLLKGRVEENTMSPQAVMEKVAALPLEKQAQVIGEGISKEGHIIILDP